MAAKQASSRSAREAAVFLALADPMRRHLLENLAEHHSRTATELANDFPITRQGIRKHLSILQDAGLVAVHQEGRDKRYVVTPAPLQQVDTWLAELEHKLDERLLRLKVFVEKDQNRIPAQER